MVVSLRARLVGVDVLRRLSPGGFASAGMVLTRLGCVSPLVPWESFVDVPPSEELPTPILNFLGSPLATSYAALIGRFCAVPNFTVRCTQRCHARC